MPGPLICGPLGYPFWFTLQVANRTFPQNIEGGHAAAPKICLLIGFFGSTAQLLNDSTSYALS
jgi:hypothetical protein